MTPSQGQFGGIPTRKRDRLTLLRRHRGLLADVARRLSVSPATVTQVYHGRSKSVRVNAAIATAIREREAA